MLKTLFSFFSGGWQGYAIAIGLALLVGATGTWRVMSWKEGAAITQQAKQTVKLVVNQGVVNAQIGDIIMPQIIVAQVAAQKHIEEIPQHVTPQIDQSYPVPLGFVRVYNDASHGPVPPATAGSDADPSGVPLSDVAAAHAADESTLDLCRIELNGWWTWYDKQSAIWNASQK